MKILQLRGFKLRTNLSYAWHFSVNLFRDYSTHSSIHGVSYIGEQGRSWVERIWWVAAISVSIFCCVALIHDAWNTDPIIISFTEKPTPIWQIPFPAVSICPSVLTHYKHMNLTQAVLQQCRGPKDERRTKQLNAVSMLCRSDVIYKNFKRYPNCNDCLATLHEIRIPPEDLFLECKFQNRKINCLESVRQTVTQLAHCYTFNGFDTYRHGADDNEVSQQWNIDEGYNPSNGYLNAYPRRATDGSLFGFHVLLRLSKYNFDYRCSQDPGFYVDYRMPYDTPDLNVKSINIQMGSSTRINLTPNKITTAKELQGYSVAKRKCYFSYEHRLKYFKQYTITNCEMECEIEKILKKCGCLPIFIEYQGNNETCGFNSRKCVERSKQTLSKKSYKACNCMPACTTVKFDVQISANRFNMSAFPKHHKIYDSEYEYADLAIYFKENQFMTSERRELFGKTEFLANCGGLLGLFLGVSVISLLEILYYCTIRLLCNVIKTTDRYQENFWQQSWNDRSDNRLMILMKKLLTDYTQKTTIQGINYATDHNLSPFERFWWMIVVVLSIVCCGSLIFDVVRHYDQSPIIVSYANEETPISEIPFPAVTICPQIVGFQVNHLYDLFTIHNQSFYDQLQAIKKTVTALSQLCDPEVFGYVDPKNETNCDSCISYLRYMMPGMDDLMVHCKFKEITHTCSHIFKDVITEAGNCYMFNGFHVYRRQNRKEHEDTKQWSLDDGYRNATNSSRLFPRHGTRSGLFIGLEVGHYLNDGLCKGPVQGFKVYIHQPNESPMVSNHFYLVPYQQYVEFYVDPKVITSAPEIRDFPVSKRQCYYSDERFLNFFKYYTQNNCVVECVANLTLKLCNCLRFHIPKVEGVKVCGISDIWCYQKVIQRSVLLNIEDSPDSCHCLPTCNSISYEIESSQSVMTQEVLEYVSYYEKALIRHKCKNRPKGTYYDSKDSKSTVLDSHSIADFSIRFREHSYVAIQRTRLYGPTELLSNFGGLLGLFLGFSLMSILELVYFCTLRLFCSLKQ